MITISNFPKVLSLMGFSKSKSKNIWLKKYDGFEISADLEQNKPVYPSDLDTGDNSSCYFAEKRAENYVVFECVVRLLDKGYRPQDIFLEKIWSIGHTSKRAKSNLPGTKSGRADITIQDTSGKVLFIIECKCAGKKYNDAKKDLFSGEDIQAFTYAASSRSTQWIQLYASDYDEENNQITISEEIIKCKDDNNILTLAKKDGSILLYANASEAEDMWRVWDETYNKTTYKGLIFGNNTKAYQIGIRPIYKEDLNPFKKEDSVANRFEEILRHNNISDKGNAFNKLLSLFICKFVDENEKNDGDIMDFQYKEGTDDYYSLYERLLRLFHVGMKKFLKEDVFYLADSYIPETLQTFTGKKRSYLEEELKRSFQKTKLLSCQVFAFREIYNEDLFMQNGKVLVEMVQLFQYYQMAYSSKQQFLGELFEQLLNQGFKQDEGQFFTPIPITRFIWNSIPLERFIDFEHNANPKVIDYACGSGHFLTEGISAIKDYYVKCGEYSGYEELREKKAVTDETISSSFYGMDKDNRLARVSKIALLLNGANNANIMAADGLAHDQSFLGPKNSFNILVANPPYSVDGFKEHLDRKILSEYEVLDLMSSSCDDIENVFVERIGHLLTSKGIAAVILPMSVTTAEDKASIKARDIIIRNFKILGMVFLGGKTFSATPTRTVIFFLEKNDNVPNRSEILKDSIEAIVSNESIDDWEDKKILSAYLHQINVKEEDYKEFITMNKPYNSWKDFEYFGEYYEEFEKDVVKEKVIKTKEFSKLSPADQVVKLTKKFYEKYIDIEREKIYLFALTYTQETVIVQGPQDNEQQKKFLGYDNSQRKRQEGLSEREGLLTNPEDRYDETKLAWVIRQFFDGIKVTIPALSSYVTFSNLSSQFDFSTPDFQNKIYAKPISSYRIPSRYRYRRLSRLLKDIEGNQTKIQANEIAQNGKYPVVTQEVGVLYSGYSDEKNPITDLPVIVFGDHSCSVKYVQERFIRGADGTQLLKVDEEKCLPKYLYHYLSCVDIPFKGSYERHYKYVQDMFIPIPPENVQKGIILECDLQDEICSKIKRKIGQLNAEMNKIISGIETELNKGHIKFEKKKLKEVAPYSTKKTPLSSIDISSYISTDNMISDYGGIRLYDGDPNIKDVVLYHKGDVLVSNIRPYLKKIWFADKDGGCSPDVLVFHADQSIVRAKYVYYSLHCDEFFAHVMGKNSGTKMPRGEKTNTEKYEIIVPKDMKIQDAIISRLEKIEKKIKSLEKDMKNSELDKECALKNKLL